MMRFLPILFLTAIALEIASIIWVGGLIGVLPTLVLMILGMVAGVRLIKSAGMSVAEALRSPVQTGSPLKGLGGRAAARAASGLFFLLPGFFSDVIGLCLFMPPVRHWLGARFRVETYTMSQPASGSRFDQVIEAEAVEISGELDAPDRTRG